MSRKPLTLAVAGLAVVAAALAARMLSSSGSGPAPAEGSPRSPPPGTESPAGPASPERAAQLPAGTQDGGDFVVFPDAPEDAVDPPRLGGWLRSGRLPMCGRSSEVTLRTEPGGPPGNETLPACEAAYGEFPSVQLLPVGPRRGSWVRIGGGWAPIDEVRSAETLTVDGREYWHDLFNATAARPEGQEIVVRGDADPCAGEVCGNAHGLWEQEQMVRERYEAEHPKGIPGAALREMEREIEEMNAAAERSWEEERRAAENRAREERTLRLPGAPSSGHAPRIETSGGAYTCCT